MKLGDAELQQATGFVIAPGGISVGSQFDKVNFGVPKHERILIASPSRSNYLRTSMLVWPVIDFARDEHGFCTTALGRIGLEFRLLRLEDIGDLGALDGKVSFVRGGYQGGNLISGPNAQNPQLFAESKTPFLTYELVAQCDSGGLHVAIFGHFVESGGQPLTAEDGQKHGGEPFSVEATIQWETLKLKGLRLGAGSWKFGHRAAPSKLDTPHRSRDPRKLEDLLIYTVTPIVAGNIWFPPEIWPKQLHRRAPTGFLMIDFEESFGGGNISFSDVRAVTVLEDGFVYGGGASNCYVTLRILRRSMLEWEFGQRDSIAMQLAGDALGSVRYWTGYGQEASDPLGCIEQRIKTLALQMKLGRDGLEISAEGELDDFEPALIARHREQRNSKLEPIRNYALTATVPWALLVARGFSFAGRSRDF